MMGAVVAIKKSLPDLAASISEEHEQAERALRDGLLHAIRAGELLLEAKREVAHGEWENWLQANVPFQPRTARAYMQLARLDPEKRQRVADLPLREALSAIRSREQKIADAEERENRPPPGPATIATVAPDGTVLYGEDAIRHLDSLPPPEPRTPRSPDEEAEELVGQLAECTARGDISDDVLIAALKRRYLTEPARATGPAEIGIEERRAQNAQLDRPKTLDDWKAQFSLQINEAAIALTMSERKELYEYLTQAIEDLNKDDGDLSIPDFLRRT